MDLKQYLIDYAGEKLLLDKETEEVTVENIVEVVADEFPEFVIAIAEENFFRGYEQAAQDFDFAKEFIENEREAAFNGTTQNK